MNLHSEFKTSRILGIDVFAMRMEQLIELADRCIQSREPLLIGVVNVAKLVNARKDPELKLALQEADVILADGAPVVWLSRMIGQGLPERLAGIDIMFELFELADRKGYGVYLLGAKPEVLEKVVEVVRRDYPHLRIAGYHHGYFSPDEEPAIAAEIRDSGADILFVAISPPKKELFLRKWRQQLGVPVCHGVGGSFDVMAGVTKRAPQWMQKCGLEWFYRLIQEPRRMWKRYLITNTIFLKLCVAEFVRAQLARSGKRCKSKADLSDAKP